MLSAKDEWVVTSDAPQERFYYTPSIIRASDNSLIVSCDIGGAVEHEKDYQPFPESAQKMVCRIYVRAPKSTIFGHTASLPMCHGRLFSLKGRLYIIGHNGQVQLAFSDDSGKTWSPLIQLTESKGWHASACNVWRTSERLYFCMERRADSSILGWNVAGLAPHVLSVGLTDDLTNPKSWKISNSFTFSDLFANPRFEYFGLPFMATGYRWPALTFVAKGKVLKSSPMGWLEGNVFQITDPEHVWFDPNGRTFHILLRCNTAGVGYGAILKVVEDENFDLYTELVRAPSGEPLVFLPLPGGHNKFFLLYDEATQTYWLASTQPIDSMRRVDHLRDKRFGLPNNERNRLVLYFSRNCVDWIFAGPIAIGEREQHSRNYPSMIIDGNDLLIVSRAGTDQAKDGQYNDAIMLHRIPRFRDLIY